MQNLKTKVNEITKLIPKNAKVIYLDYPLHFNIGDLAIYLGTLQFFKDNNINVLESFNVHNMNYKRISKIIKKYKDVIFLWHGGGNMGDTYYLKYEKKGEDFINHFGDNEIIFLPQSIYFKDQNKLKKSISYYNKENITVLVRDTYSYDLVKDLYSKANILLFPDMAHCLFNTNILNVVESKAVADKLIISRTDDESIKTDISKINADITDWPILISPVYKIYGYFIAGFLKISSIFGLNPAYIVMLWVKFSESLLKLGISKLSKYPIVETDRLHGFILSKLLNIKVITNDNYYGKISRYFNTWFK